MIPLLIAAGTALQVYGQYKANVDQAQAEIENAQFYQEQADFARAAQSRQEQIISTDYSRLFGAQKSAYGKGGVDISGSAAGVVAATTAAKVSELLAARKKGELDVKLAVLRGQQSQDVANRLNDPGYNTLQAATTVLGVAAARERA